MSIPFARTWARLTQLVGLTAQVFRRGPLDAQVAAPEVEQRPADVVAAHRLNDAAQVHRVVTGLNDPVDVARQIGNRFIEDRQAGAPEREVGIAESAPWQR